MAAKRLKKAWRTFVLLSDGELDEGSNWEAFMFAAHHKLTNLVAIIDYNKLQSLTTVDKTLRVEPLIDKLTAFGWRAVELDGHDHFALIQALIENNTVDERPLVIVAHTTKGKGVGFMEDKVEWHYKSPDAIQLKQAIAEIEAAA